MPHPEGLKDFSLGGKAALVIGAEHPVGRTAAVTLVEAGARVLLASQEPGTDDALSQTAAAVQAAGQKNPPIQAQSAVLRADVSATVDRALKELGGLDIMITALDQQFFGPIETVDDSTFDRIMEENFKAVWLSCQEAGRVMLQRGGGVIVNISNVMAERGVPNATLYCAAKGAVRNLIRALALEWARRNIRINMVECGWLDSDDSPARQEGEFSERLIKYLPYRRLLKPEEIAGALLYLVSPAAGFVTGESVAVDGGLLCRV
ncbi:MAG TPA: SDR family oxidoreductase [Candidatus Binataceae bacterium]|nr:SDR family oxidoreductase [Candidatus Binataceae bacterium]